MRDRITLRGTWVVLVFGGVHVAHVFSFLCCVFCFVCLRPVPCVRKVPSVCGLSILDCPFGFLLTYGSEYQFGIIKLS